MFGRIKDLQGENMECYCEGTKTNVFIKKRRPKVVRPLSETSMLVAWDALLDASPGYRRPVTPFKPSKAITRKWKALSAKDCRWGSKCHGFRLDGKYTVSTDASGNTKLIIEGKLRSKRRRNKDKLFGIVSALSMENGSEWSSVNWEPNQ